MTSNNVCVCAFALCAHRRVLVADATGLQDIDLDVDVDPSSITTAAELLALARKHALRGIPILPIQEIANKNSRDTLQAALLTYEILLPFLGNDALLEEVLTTIGIEDAAERLSIIDVLRRMLLEGMKTPYLDVGHILPRSG